MDESHRVTATCVLPSGSVGGGRAGVVNTPASERRTWRLRRVGRAVPGQVGSAAFRVSDLGRWARFKNRRFLRRSAPCVRRSQHRVDTQRDESSRTEHTCAPSTRVERAPPAPSRRPPRVPLRPQRPPLLAALPPPAFRGRRPPRPLPTREERRVRRARLLCHVGFAIPTCPRVSSRVLVCARGGLVLGAEGSRAGTRHRQALGGPRLRAVATVPLGIFQSARRLKERNKHHVLHGLSCAGRSRPDPAAATGGVAGSASAVRPAEAGPRPRHRGRSATPVLRGSHACG